MKNKHIKLFESFDEEEIKHPETFSPEEEQAIADAIALADAGVISQEAAKEVRKKFVDQHMQKIRSMYRQEVGSDVDIAADTWLSSRYGKTLTSELVKAVLSENFRELTNKGFRIEKMSFNQAVKGNVTLYVPGKTAKIIISRSNFSIRRLLPASTTPIKKYPDGTKDFYLTAFDFVSKTIDPSDPDLATYRGAQLKKKWQTDILKIKETIRTIYTNLVGREVADIVMERAVDKAISHIHKDLTTLSALTDVKVMHNLVARLAKHGILYLPIESYDDFFTRQLEDLFVDRDIKWEPKPFFKIGTIIYHRTGLIINKRRSDLFYTALDNINNLLFASKIEKIYVNADQVSSKTIEKLQEHPYAIIELYYNR